MIPFWSGIRCQFVFPVKVNRHRISLGTDHAVVVAILTNVACLVETSRGFRGVLARLRTSWVEIEP